MGERPTTIRIWVLAAALLAGAATHSQAQDVGPGNWNGIYIGYHFGYFDGRSVVEDQNLLPFNYGRLARPRGLFDGLTAGFNQHLSKNWVIGIEVDVSDAGRVSGTSPLDIVSQTNITRVDSFGSSRLRLGYAWNRTLLYVTGGAAVAKVRSFDITSAGVITLDSRSYNVGWIAGLGFEYQIYRNWSLKAEYLYADFGGMTNRQGPSSPPSPNFYNSIDLKAGIARVGVNYRFSDPLFNFSESNVTSTSFRWDGPYLGLVGAYGWGDQYYRYGIEEVDFAPKGGAVAFQIGYNWEPIRNFVLGIETDYGFANLRNTGVSTLPGIGNRSAKTTVDQIGTTRFRAGLALGQVLIFGTAGIGYAHIDVDLPLVPGFPYGAGRKNFHAGLVVGGGAEFAFSPAWAIKFEYLKFDLGDANQLGGNLSLSSLNFEMIRVGVNYKGVLLQ